MKKIKKIVSIILLIILLPILVVNGIIILDSFVKPDEVPSFFGWKPFIVLSGSMETEIYSGDIAVVREVPASEIKKDDVIAFKDGDVVVTHRIVEVVEENGETKYKTKGDNNNIEDRGFVLPEQIEGLYQFKISRLGNVALFIQTPIGIVSCLSVPIGLLIILQSIETKRNKKYEEEKLQKEKALEEEIERLKQQNEELKKNNS
ncbi:MAG: signal peptidase I [Clostridia bacterium]|nr:signal peptidase I [Clostridia bacterium]